MQSCNQHPWFAACTCLSCLHLPVLQVGPHGMDAMTMLSNGGKMNKAGHVEVFGCLPALNADLCPLEAYTAYELYCYLFGGLPVPDPFDREKYAAVPLLGRSDPKECLDADTMATLITSWWKWAGITNPKCA